MEIIVERGQNIFDLSIQYFGDISFAPNIINDNDLTWNAELSTGQKLQINSQGLGDEQVKNFFAASGIVVANVSSRASVTFDSEVITFDSEQVTFDAT